MSNLLRINLINKNYFTNIQINSCIRSFTKKAIKVKYVETNINLPKLNKTCYNYDNLLNINNNKNNNLNQYSSNDIVPTHVLNTDYHTLMALKHASCGAINVDYFYQLKNEKKNN
tara:strand:- start:282 stop:626 length:345 start_codon:yes stop_codon:yes gene_type:complete